MADKDNDLTKPIPSTDPLGGPSGPERDASGDEGTRRPEDYSIDEKITPPAEQTRARRATVIGTAEGTEEPLIEDGQADPADTKPGAAKTSGK